MIAAICRNNVVMISIGIQVFIHDMLDKYIEIEVIDKKVVFVFPSILETGSFPFNFEAQLIIAMIASKISMMIMGITN